MGSSLVFEDGEQSRASGLPRNAGRPMELFASLIGPIYDGVTSSAA